LNYWSEQLTDASARSNATRHKDASDKIETLLVEYHEVESEIRDADPRYALLTPHFLRVSDIQKQVLDPETVLLEYALGDQSSHLWVLTSESLDHLELPSKKVIEGAITLFYRLMKHGNSNAADAAAQLKSAAGQLSRILLPLAAARIHGKRLVIAGDSLIGTLPFAGLPSPESGVPLIKTHELVILPSAAMLAEQRRLAFKHATPTKSLAVVADPVFDADDVRVRGPRIGLQPTFARLPFTRSEAQAILNVASKSEVLRAFDFDAVRDLFTSNRLAEYKILHIATHAVVDPEHPELSSLVFSRVNQRGMPREGYLHLYEIASLRLQANLVTLSACGTGVGKQVPGEGTVGLGWGFLHAGAKTVVVSLWDVDDGSTAELMRLFYQNLLGTPHLRPAAALRQAQISMFRTRPSAVFSWSGWTVIGEWR
jgi:CHAT domain-containing protein